MRTCFKLHAQIDALKNIRIYSTQFVLSSTVQLQNVSIDSIIHYDEKYIIVK